MVKTTDISTSKAVKVHNQVVKRYRDIDEFIKKRRNNEPNN